MENSKEILSDRSARASNRDALRQAIASSTETIVKQSSTATTETVTQTMDDGGSTYVVDAAVDRGSTHRKALSSNEYPYQSASSQQFSPSTRTVPDSFAPPAFSGLNIDADAWHFKRYSEYRQLSDTDVAVIWYDALSAELKNDVERPIYIYKQKNIQKKIEKRVWQRVLRVWWLDESVIGMYRWARVDRDNVWYQLLRYCYLSLDLHCVSVTP